MKSTGQINFEAWSEAVKQPANLMVPGWEQAGRWTRSGAEAGAKAVLLDQLDLMASAGITAADAAKALRDGRTIESLVETHCGAKQHGDPPRDCNKWAGHSGLYRDGQGEWSDWRLKWDGGKDPCKCGGEGNGVNGFHYPGAHGCKLTDQQIAKLATKREPPPPTKPTRPPVKDSGY